MQTVLPRATSCDPPFGESIGQLPPEFSPKNYLNFKIVFLYNPINRDVRFSPVSPDSLTLLDQKNSFVVTHNKNMDYEAGQESERKKFSQLNDSFDIMIDYVSNQLALELSTKPKNMKNNKMISPEDIKNVIQSPNRALRPGGPSKQKLAAPKPKFKKR